MTEVLSADFAEMDRNRAALMRISESVRATGLPARAAADDAVEATGEFRSDLARGAATFGLSWWMTLDFYGECADLLADNIGRAVLVLANIDTMLGGRLSPESTDACGSTASGRRR